MLKKTFLSPTVFQPSFAKTINESLSTGCSILNAAVSATGGWESLEDYARRRRRCVGCVNVSSLKCNPSAIRPGRRSHRSVVHLQEMDRRTTDGFGQIPGEGWFYVRMSETEMERSVYFREIYTIAECLSLNNLISIGNQGNLKDFLSVVTSFFRTILKYIVSDAERNRTSKSAKSPSLEFSAAARQFDAELSRTLSKKH